MTLEEFERLAANRHSGRPFMGMYARGWRLVVGEPSGPLWRKQVAGGRFIKDEQAFRRDLEAEWKVQSKP